MCDSLWIKYNILCGLQVFEEELYFVIGVLECYFFFDCFYERNFMSLSDLFCWVILVFEFNVVVNIEVEEQFYNSINCLNYLFNMMFLGNYLFMM